MITIQAEAVEIKLLPLENISKLVKISYNIIDWLSINYNNLFFYSNGGRLISKLKDWTILLEIGNIRLSKKTDNPISYFIITDIPKQDKSCYKEEIEYNKLFSSYSQKVTLIYNKVLNNIHNKLIYNDIDNEYLIKNLDNFKDYILKEQHEAKK